VRRRGPAARPKFCRRLAAPGRPKNALSERAERSGPSFHGGLYTGNLCLKPVPRTCLVFASTRRCVKDGRGMGKQFARIEPEHAAFIERQEDLLRPLAPPPKGTRHRLSQGPVSFRVLGETDVALPRLHWQRQRTARNLIASDDKRLTIHVLRLSMALPMIPALYGQGRSLMRGTPGVRRSRSEVRGSCRGAPDRTPVGSNLVQTSCGMGVPCSTTSRSVAASCALDGAGRQQSAKNTGV